MSQVVETVDVAVPVRTAYNQWTQFEEFPAFMDSVREIRQLDDTRLHWVVEFGGVRREFDARDHRAAPGRAGRMDVDRRPRSTPGGHLPPARRHPQPGDGAARHRPGGVRRERRATGSASWTG